MATRILEQIISKQSTLLIYFNSQFLLTKELGIATNAPTGHKSIILDISSSLIKKRLRPLFLLLRFYRQLGGFGRPAILLANFAGLGGKSCSR